MAREVIKTGQVVEIGDNSQITDPDRITEVTILEKTTRGYGRQNNR